MLRVKTYMLPLLWQNILQEDLILSSTHYPTYWVVKAPNHWSYFHSQEKSVASWVWINEELCTILLNRPRRTFLSRGQYLVHLKAKILPGKILMYLEFRKVLRRVRRSFFVHFLLLLTSHDPTVKSSENQGPRDEC